MQLPDQINLKKEFNFFIEHIKKTWNIPDTFSLEIAAKEAFNLGLSDARLSFDRFFTYEIGKLINKNEDLEPLKTRNDITDDKGLFLSSYDSLCCFDSSLIFATTIIHRHLTDYKNFNYKDKVDLIVNDFYHKYPTLLNSKPLKLSKEQQQKYISDYKGFNANNLYFSNTIYRMSYDHTIYNENNGRNFFHSLICGFYTHGLACITQKNTNSLIIHFYDLYSNFSKLDICIGNNIEIMNQAQKHPFMSLFEKVYKFNFPTQQDYLNDYNNHKEISESELESIIFDCTDSLILEFSTEEHKKSESERELYIGKIIEDFKSSIKIDYII